VDKFIFSLTFLSKGILNLSITQEERTLQLQTECVTNHGMIHNYLYMESLISSVSV